MKHNPYVVSVVLNWNGATDTVDCVRSLQAVRYCNHDIVVIDNGSTDNSVSVLSACLPDTILIRNKVNLGYAEGNNVGIRWAMDRGADFIFVLNNDAVVADDALTVLVDVARGRPSIGMMSPKIYYHTEPQRIWYAGGCWSKEGYFFYHAGHRGVDDGVSHQTIANTDYASGCALFVSSKLVENIGLMDPKFFLTYEETDWCYRARKAGYDVLFVPNARVWHKVSASFGAEYTPMHAYFYTRNILLWGERHLSRREFVALLFKTARSVFPVSMSEFNESGWIKRMYWSINCILGQIGSNSLKPGSRAKYLGLRDYVLRRFGDCPSEVRELAN